jgi:hypothetical protein
MMYIPINKCGCTSLHHAFNEEKYETKWEFRHRAIWSDWPKVVMVRDPRERLESYYRMRNPTEEFAPWALWMMLHRLTNPHMAPQYWHVSEDDKLLPNLEFIYWDFPKFQERFGLKSIPHMHKGKPRKIEWTHTARQTLEDKYSEDYKYIH